MSIRDDKLKEYLGKIYDTKSCGQVVVVDYINHKNLMVKFEDGNIFPVRTGDIKNGEVKNPLQPSYCGVGFMGVGKHSLKSLAGTKWMSMMKRCYDPKYLARKPTYIGCSVESSWHNFQNFAQWFESLDYNADDWELDKDLLIRGNKVYSESSCVMLPRHINCAINIYKSDKNSELPAGVTTTNSIGKFRAQCQVGDGQEYSSVSTSVDYCFQWYKEKKMEQLRGLAEYWKEYLDPRAYCALVNFEVTPYVNY